MCINGIYLQYRSMELAEEIWHTHYNLEIRTDRRFRQCLGKFYGSINDYNIRMPDHISIANFVLKFDRKFIDIVLKHELCHWYMFKTYQPYLDSDDEFQEELIRIGAVIEKNPSGKFFTFICPVCKKVCVYCFEKHTMSQYLNNPYISSCCNANIEYIGLQKFDHGQRAN